MMTSIDQYSFSQPFESNLDFYRLRSECIDSFAMLEASIYRLAALLKIESETKGQLSQLLKKLKVAPASPQLSRVNASKLKDLCEKAAPLLDQRADLVHSQMKVVCSPSECLAIFQNAIDVSAGQPDARVYNTRMMSELADEVQETSSQFDNVRNKSTKITPPSSPPLPSPGAAAGP